ncbi:MAG: hypothetical protein AABZ02_11085 [Bacteroidota bacterium]
MYVDWITWSIWLLGFVILVVWIIVPLKEFKKLVAEKRKEHEG